MLFFQACWWKSFFDQVAVDRSLSLDLKLVKHEQVGLGGDLLSNNWPDGSRWYEEPLNNYVILSLWFLPSNPSRSYYVINTSATDQLTIDGHKWNWYWELQVACMVLHGLTNHDEYRKPGNMMQYHCAYPSLAELENRYIACNLVHSWSQVSTTHHVAGSARVFVLVFANGLWCRGPGSSVNGGFGKGASTENLILLTPRKGTWWNCYCFFLANEHPRHLIPFPHSKQ